MATPTHHIAFGPVPSRRLGQSLGINNVAAKACSYTCVYCQIGPTTDKRIAPRQFFTPEEILSAVTTQIEKLPAGGRGIDYLSFVPDGEPTLDSRLGDSIDALRVLDIPVAVITNASLLWREDVRKRVARADLVSIKVDSVDEAVWRRINLPHRELDLAVILRGIRSFAREYTGSLISDTMLVAGINDTPHSLVATAEFLAEVAPRTAYLAVPTRPPTVADVRGADETGLTRAHETFSGRLPAVELLTGAETGTFGHTGNARTDLLSITAVHPLRESAIRRILAEDRADWDIVEALLAEGALKAVEYDGARFFLRPVNRNAPP